ncbi:MAG: hypothetical protein RBQ91_01445 [Acholeplasma sp.]|nr:hypothetical protein [Acholeplasma sp.]
MKNLIKKPWFIGSSLMVSLGISYALLLATMNLKLGDPYDVSLFSLSRNVTSGTYMNVLALITVLMFYVLIVPLLITAYNLFKKRNKGIMLGSIGLLLLSSLLLALFVSTGSQTGSLLVLIIFSMAFELFALVLSIYQKKRITIEVESITKLDDKSRQIAFKLLWIDALSILVLMTTFFIPLYTRTDTTPTHHAILIRALFSGDTNIEVVAYFLVSFMALIGTLLYFANVLSNYFFDQKQFVIKSKDIINLTLALTFTFFIAGLVLNIYYTLKNVPVQTVAFIPVLLMISVNFLHAVFKGSFYNLHPVGKPKIKVKYAKVEPVLYTVLLTLVTVGLLWLPIIVMKVSFGTFEHSVRMTGFKILRDYADLENGYRMVAFVLVVMLIASGISLVTTITSYLSNSKTFNSIVKMSAGVNVFFVFIVAISGYYFKIAQAINEAVIMDMFEFYGVILPEGYDYTYVIGTDAIYALFVSLAILSVMFFRKSFERPSLDTKDNLDFAFNEANHSNKLGVDSNDNEANSNTFDPAPALTFLDGQVEFYQKDFTQRQTKAVTGKSLNDLVMFVVDYAKNSRLHLSYTPEDIATFIAGLGASRLSVLQGMSGTGKTSLPKIFTEAILGNCEIIEVESSWKDKNELLGYYNEFSMIYTPKKFTLALYKAALNKDIFTVILLDEMNLSRIEYYFSDFLSLMEHEENKRAIKLLNININRKEDGKEVEYRKLIHGNTLIVPLNVWFIGTANRDESTFVISDKVYDRAHTMNFTKRAPKVRNYTNPIDQQYYDYNTINELLESAKKLGNFDAEKSELIKSVELLLAPFNISFGNRILKQIEEFVNVYKACFMNEDVEDEAVEKIILSKVVQKLETKTIDDKEKLEEAFEKLKLYQCAEFVRRLDID